MHKLVALLLGAWLLAGCSQPAPAPSASPSAADPLKAEFVKLYAVEDELANRRDWEHNVLVNADPMIVDGQTLDRKQQLAKLRELEPELKKLEKELGFGPLQEDQHQEVIEVTSIDADHAVVKSKNLNKAWSTNGRWRLEAQTDQVETWERQKDGWKRTEAIAKAGPMQEYVDGKPTAP